MDRAALKMMMARTRARQFEAFIAHSTNKTPATGTIYWQANKGWPTLLWDLYNQDGDQAGSFFGAKKANEGLHVLYGYDNHTVTVDNLGGEVLATTRAQLGYEVVFVADPDGTRVELMAPPSKP